MKMQSNSRALDKIYKRRNRYEIPEWQRQEVWGKSKKQNLIDTILRGWKLPKFYLLKTNDSPEEFEVVDGQQRLATVFDFFDNELALSPVSAEKFKASYYHELPDLLSDQFDDYEIEYDVIEGATDEEVKEFFQRLQEGLPLTSSEKLNSVHSKLRDFVAIQAKHPLFKKKVLMSDRRYGHFDILAKAVAVEIDGIEVGFRYDDLRAVFESQANFSAESNVAKRLKTTLDYLDKAFNEPNPHLRNRTIVQSLITLATRVVASERADGHEQELKTFFNQFMTELARQVELGSKATDADYLAFQRTINANVRSGPRVRQEILLRKLLASNPSFSSVFDSSTIEESGISIHIKRMSAAIVDLINEINESYSAAHGQDLFKPTNKTVLSQVSIAKTLNDYAEYRVFIDNLYFLFYESTGQRLQVRPKSFKDINALRTALEHDVDHGSARKIRAKKKKIGQVFFKYSGSIVPEALAPEQFKIVQANILKAIHDDLKTLNK